MPQFTPLNCTTLHSSAVDGTDDDILWIAGEKDRTVRSECEEEKGTDCGDTVTLIGKDTLCRHAQCIKCMQSIKKKIQ